ncbi:MAG: ATP-binding protein [Deltaproteobacteria bacterium]|nr:ATP-binding protein [Deltaproteobacteria bacterium]
MSHRFEIPIEHSIIDDLAQHTISDIIDAIVELVTNADDSYTRKFIAQGKENQGGKIEVTVRRAQGNKATFLSVTDEAEGMSYDKVQQALHFAAKTSGFMQNKPVRGFWGRGLKETIAALGKGYIDTTFSQERTVAEVYRDDKDGKFYATLSRMKAPERSDGTEIRIEVSRDIDCPESETLQKRLIWHYAMRDIIKRREVVLYVDSQGGRGRSPKPYKAKIPLKPPELSGSLCLDKKLDTVFGEAQIQIWEAPEPLSFRKNDASSQAGIVIKTEGAALDISLFGLENEPGANYFYGEIFCPGIAQRVREDADGENLIDFNRRGLNWHDNRLVQEFESQVKEILRPLIEEKKTVISSVSLEKMKPLYKYINTFIYEELGDGGHSDDGNGGHSDDGISRLDSPMNSLTVYPPKARALPHMPRHFTLYLPAQLAPADPIIDIVINSSSPFTVEPSTLHLKPHQKEDDLLTGNFAVTGQQEGATALIVCTVRGFQGNPQYEASATITIGQPGHHEKRDTPPSRTGGFIQEIRYIPLKSFTQRAWVDEDKKVIYINSAFPGVASYIKPRPRPKSQMERVVVAMLVCEAICRYIAARKIERGLIGGDNSYYAYLAEFDRLLFKCSDIIHQYFIKYQKQ